MNIKKLYQFCLLTVVMGIVTVGILVAQPVSEVQDLPVTVSSSVGHSPHDAGILYMREEEKLARDVYLAMYDVWGIRIFANIARSEQMHMDAVATLIEAQGLVDPTIDSSKLGEFKNLDLASLYSSLVEQGKKSLQEAFLVGSIIEDLDISDLETYLSETEDPASIAVYTFLLRGSENHMRSFTRQLTRYNFAYEPRYISPERLDAILYW